MRQKKLLSLLLAVVMLASLGTVGVFAEETATSDISYIENLSFDDGTFPANFAMWDVETNEEYMSDKRALTVTDGKLNFTRTNSISKSGGLTYTFKEALTLADLQYEKLVFEYDFYPNNLSENGAHAFYTDVSDSEGKVYSRYYITLDGGELKFIQPTGWEKMPLTAGNTKYYKVKITIDIINSKRTVAVAEMTSGEETEAVYTTLANNLDYFEIANGTISKIDLLKVDGWGTTDVSYDNFKIYKEGYIDPNVLADVDFEDGTIPVLISNITPAAGNAYTLSVKDGKMDAVTSTIKGGGIAYDLSSFGKLEDLNCKRVIIEYDYYLIDVDTANERYLRTKLVDSQGTIYNHFAALTKTQKFDDNVTWAKKDFVSHNVSETDTNKYYKVKMTIDILNEKQTLEIAEMSVGDTTSSPVYTKLSDKRSYSADGTLGELRLISCEDSNWGGKINVQFDNLKIYKDGIIDPNALVDVDFEDSVIPAKLMGMVNSDGDFTNTIVDGKLNAVTKLVQYGGLAYDISDLGTLSALNSEKLVFEYDYYPVKIDTSGSRSHHIKITDTSGNNYNDFYLYTGSTPCFYSPVNRGRIDITANNASDTDVDKYYKIKMTLNVLNSTQTVDIAEMNVGDTASTPVYANLMKNIAYTADGTLDKLVFLVTEGNGYHETGLTVQIDNLKIYKQEVTTVKYENNTAVITVTNIGDTSMDFIGFFAVYGNNGALTGCQILTPETALGAGESKTFNCAYSEGGNIKVFTWDKNMQPFAHIK